MFASKEWVKDLLSKVLKRNNEKVAKWIDVSELLSINPSYVDETGSLPKLYKCGDLYALNFNAMKLIGASTNDLDYTVKITFDTNKKFLTCNEGKTWISKQGAYTNISRVYCNFGKAGAYSGPEINILLTCQGPSSITPSTSTNYTVRDTFYFIVVDDNTEE